MQDIPVADAVMPLPVASTTTALRILFLVDELEGISSGGSERQVLQLIDIFRHAGHNVSLAVLRKSEWLRDEASEYEIRFCGVDSVLSLAGMIRLWKFVRWMRQQRFDVVQTMFREANLIGPPLARLAGVPVVLGSRRNLNYAMSGSFALLQSISNRFATRLVANSQAVKNIVGRRERTSAAKIDVLYNGVDTAYFASQPAPRADARSSFGIPESAVLVGVVSRFAPIKGLDVFLRAAKEATNSAPETHFMIVGSGPTLSDTRALAVQLHLQDRFTFVPAQRDIRPFLWAFDIAVLPSRSEGFSNSLLEYMSAGVAIVATDVGGNREALGAAGLLVPAEDEHALAKAISELIRNPEERKRVGQNARVRAEELFDIQGAKIRVAQYLAELSRRAGATQRLPQA